MKATQKNTIAVTSEELAQIIANHKGASPITFQALTEVKMPKKGNPYFGRIQKMQVLNAFFNFNYENSVNKARTKEGNEEAFVAASNWGTHDTLGVIDNKGIKYLQVRPKKSISVEYFCDGLPISKNEIAVYLPQPSASSRQNVSDANEVVVRRFTFSNIMSASLRNNIYKVI